MDEHISMRVQNQSPEYFCENLERIFEQNKEIKRKEKEIQEAAAARRGRPPDVDVTPRA
jgi:hypothetical protein